MAALESLLACCGVHLIGLVVLVPSLAFMASLTAAARLS